MVPVGHGCSFLLNNNKQKFKILAVEPIQFDSLVRKWGEFLSPFLSTFINFRVLIPWASRKSLRL